MRAERGSPVSRVMLPAGMLLLAVLVAECLHVWSHRLPSRLKPQPVGEENGASGAASSSADVQVPSSLGSSPGFVDVSADSGIDFQMTFLNDEQGENFKINFYDHGCGLAVADYDNDGHADVLLLNQLGANALYRNRGDGRFDRVTDDASPIAMTDRVCVGAAFGDYDNDGDPDLYVTSTRGGNLLFENECGLFRDVTEQAGVSLVAHSQTAAFFDYDNDGDLDLYVTNTAKWTADRFDEAQHHYVGLDLPNGFLANPEDFESNVLFRNDGDGSFTDVTREAGLQGIGWAGDVAVFDFDEDGWQDVFVTHMFGFSQLYQNDGRGHYQDVTKGTLGKTSYGAIGAKAFDFDNDGRLDLFVSDMHSDMWDLPSTVSEVRPRAKRAPRGEPMLALLRRTWGDDFAQWFLFGSSLYHSVEGNRFVECSDEAGMETYWPWGAVAGDFDNDGDQDVFLPSGMGYPFFYWPNALLVNDGGGKFAERAEAWGMEPPRAGLWLPDKIGGHEAARSSRCAASGDFNHDGCLDLIVNNFNDRPYYFKNELPPLHYVEFRLHGVQSNRDAVGAVVRLHRGEQVMVRQVDCSGGYLSQSSKTLHFGLGDDPAVERLEILWPSGTRQTIDSPQVDQLTEIVEPG